MRRLQRGNGWCWNGRWNRCGHQGLLARPGDDRGPCRRGRAVAGDEGADAVERVGGDATAVAQPRGKLAVVDGAPSESRLGKSAVAAIVGNLLQQFLGVHDCASGAGDRVAPWFPSEASFAPPSWLSEPREMTVVNHKSSHSASGIDHGTAPTADGAVNQITKAFQ